MENILLEISAPAATSYSGQVSHGPVENFLDSIQLTFDDESFPETLKKERSGMNKKYKIYLAVSGFLGGIGFTMIAFYFNHKNIFFENVYFWLLVFLASLGFCLKAIFKDAK
jgi:hypothetical protein